MQLHAESTAAHLVMSYELLKAIDCSLTWQVVDRPQGQGFGALTWLLRSEKVTLLDQMAGRGSIKPHATCSDPSDFEIAS